MAFTKFSIIILVLSLLSYSRFTEANSYLSSHSYTPPPSPNPTSSPIAAPTPSPTPSTITTPTSSLTSPPNPTPSPIVAPTSSLNPTPSPIAAPTSSPTPSPIVALTLLPNPTSSPTDAPSPSPTVDPPSSQNPCPVDTLKLGVCAGILGLINLGNPPLGSNCCALLDSLVDSEAATCLCIALKANVLGINLNVPLNLSLILSACQKTISPNYECE